jgi:2-haloacid dehalogenase
VDRWATFDCYGTLIDWNGGIRTALAQIWPAADPDALLARFHIVEPELETDGTRTYREILAEAVTSIAAAEGLEVPDGSGAALAELRSRGWRLAILSNTDPDYLEASIERIGVEVDERVVASDIGSYKPAFAHWETFFRRTDADRTRHVHVAASLFHDVAPAAALGLLCVWINRLGETSDLPRAGELPDLAGLPDFLDELVPG